MIPVVKSAQRLVAGPASIDVELRAL